MGWPSLVQGAQQVHPSLWDATLSPSTAVRAWRRMPVSQTSSSNTRAFGFRFSSINLAEAEAGAGRVSYRPHLSSSVQSLDKEWGPAGPQAAGPPHGGRPAHEAASPCRGRSCGSRCCIAAAFSARLCRLALFHTLFHARRRRPGRPQQKALAPP